MDAIRGWGKIVGIKAVSFDVDGTLWDFRSVMRRSLHQVLLELVRMDPNLSNLITVDGMISIRNYVYNNWRGLTLDLEEIRRESFRQILSEIGCSDNRMASHLASVYFEHRYADNILFRETLPVLKELGQRYLIGIISNGISFVEDLGLGKIVKFTTYAQDCGAEKPNPRIFKVALEKAGCLPKEFVHVGDSLKSDIAGANLVGVKSIWINRARCERRASIKPDLEVESLRGLLEFL